MSTREAYAVNQPIRGNYMTGADRILSMPRVSVYRIAADSFVSVTQRAFIWDTLDYQSEGMWSATTPTRITSITAGVYAFSAWLGWASDVNAYRQLFLRKNGAGIVIEDVRQAAAGAGTVQSVSAQISLNAGDYVEAWASQGTAGALAILTATAANRENGFQACLVST